MKVQIVGLGKVGRSFAEFLRRRGVEVLEYSAREGKGRLEDAPLLFIAVKDDHIGDVARSLYERGLRYEAVGHFSGALTSDVLKPYPERFSLHPLQAFNSPDPCLWNGITVGVEGTSRAVLLLRRLMYNLPVRMVEIPKEAKVLYHAAAVFVSNLIYAPLVAGEELFGSLGLSRDDYARLVRTSFNNFLRRGLDGLTGPLVRGDEGTLRRHLNALEGREDLRELYEALTDFLRRRLRERQE
ncbi:MAG: DUF2520 domain-containing protein [Thermotogae bacterium]|nr:DUF2520 domain-containing protein [Thermotogota bacterium]